MNLIEFGLGFNILLVFMFMAAVVLILLGVKSIRSKD
jgi:hypothetical protein